MPIIFSKYPNIVADIDYCDGKPRINGTRITISALLSYMAGGMTIEKILEAFPQLTQDDVTQALSFAANQFQIKELPVR